MTEITKIKLLNDGGYDGITADFDFNREFTGIRGDDLIAMQGIGMKVGFEVPIAELIEAGYDCELGLSDGANPDYDPHRDTHLYFRMDEVEEV